MKRRLSLALLALLASCDFLSPERPLVVGEIADLVVPDSVGKTDSLHLTLIVGRGACLSLDHVQVQEMPNGILFTAWMKDSDGGSVTAQCPDVRILAPVPAVLAPSKRRDPMILFFASAGGAGGQKSVIWR